MALRKEFWAVEVKAGQPLKVNPGEATIIRLKQASLGVSKSKVSELVPVSVKFGGQKVVLGNLSTCYLPQIYFDLVFEKEFELSHNSKNGSVFFFGYSTMLPEGDEYSGESDKGSPLTASGNGNGEAKPSKPEANAAKPISSGKKENDSDDDSEDEDYSNEEDDETPMKEMVRMARMIVDTPPPFTRRMEKQFLLLLLLRMLETPSRSRHQAATPHPKKDAKKFLLLLLRLLENPKQEQTLGHVVCNTYSKTYKLLRSCTKAMHSTSAK